MIWPKVQDRDALGESEDVPGNKDPLVLRETFELLRAQHKIISSPVIERGYEMVKSLAWSQVEEVRDEKAEAD